MHEFRDPVHGFIKFDSEERILIDSPPIQRLRHIHQLALTSYVYPGASHTRFEHSLGVAEIASRIFDTVSQPENIRDQVRSRLPDFEQLRPRENARFVLRSAALCHDIGHLPFSHAVEEKLFPSGFKHEHMTIEMITGDAMTPIWERLATSVRRPEVARVSVGAKYFPEPFTDLELILTDMLTGAVFGADRIDYLLRDSIHAGVAYGRFDVDRLINTLRLLPRPPAESTDGLAPQLGVQEGGLRSAEALLIARYSMFDQVYFHRVRRAYDLHLGEFMVEFANETFPDARFPTDPVEYLRWTDAHVMVRLLDAAIDTSHKAHDAAYRIVNRCPYKLLWSPKYAEIKKNSDIGNQVFSALESRFGSDAIRRDYKRPEEVEIDFPVLRDNGEVVWATELSQVIPALPIANINNVFVRPELLTEAQEWLRKTNEEISQAALPEEE